MSDDAFERLLDTEVAQYVESKVPAGAADAELLDRVLDQSTPSTATSGAGLGAKGALAGAGLIVVAAVTWFALQPQVDPANAGRSAPTVAAAEAPDDPVPSPAPVVEPAAPETDANEATDPASVPDNPAPEKPIASAAELLKRAQTHRNAGEITASVRTYRELLDNYPRSPEATISLVSIGEIELVERGKPGRALRYFDRYLARGGSLAEEARHGRVRALRKLGRTDDELEAIEALLDAHPNSIYAGSLRARKQSLKKDAD